MTNGQKKKLRDDNIVPLSVGDPAKAASLKIEQSHLDEYLADKEVESNVVDCAKPPKGLMFTVRPETGRPWKDRGLFWQLEIPGRDPYLVMPDIAEQKNKEEDVLRPVLLVRYVTMGGEEGLWPLKIDPPDGRTNKWNASARNIMEIAANGTLDNPGQKWVRLISMRKHYGYQISKKTIADTPPRFSDQEFDELVLLAHEGRIIGSLDHEIWSVLANGER